MKRLHSGSRSSLPRSPAPRRNQVGVQIIREQLGVEAFNAVSNPAELGDYLIARLGLQNVGEPKAVGA